MKSYSVVFVLFLIVLQACGKNGGSSGGSSSVISVSGDGNTKFDSSTLEENLEDITKGTLTEQERNGLLLMREEEKLARDVYAGLFDKHGITIFNNISQSEQTHMDAVKSLLDRYSITDPVTDNARGVFSSSVIQNLYTELLSKGEASQNAALLVGAEIEELDIFDLIRLEGEIENNEDIALVYSNLRKGSRNHLRAFSKQIIAAGLSYEAKYLTQTEVDAILAASMETGSQ